MRLLFKELNSRKSPGPDNISLLLLKSCHNELSGVYQHLFQLSISSGILRIWKTAVIVPVPKKTTAKEYNDYRPIALTETSHHSCWILMEILVTMPIRSYARPVNALAGC